MEDQPKDDLPGECLEAVVDAGTEPHLCVNDLVALAGKAIPGGFRPLGHSPIAGCFA